MRLLFFGDSLTYGYGLPDCIIDNDNGLHWGNIKPSQFGWASLVAKDMGLTGVNLSRPGSSNMEIHWKIRSHKAYRPDDLIVVQWSYPNRDMLLDDHLVQIGPWIGDEKNTSYYRVHEDVDMIRRTLLIIEHTALWLSHHGFKWIFFANAKLPIYSHVDDMITDYYNDYLVDDGVDKIHPGLKTNSGWAVMVGRYLKTLISSDQQLPEIPLSDSISRTQVRFKT